LLPCWSRGFGWSYGTASVPGVEDRIRAAQDRCCWTQALLLNGPLAVAEPKTLRYRLLHVAARIVRHARRPILRLQASWPWAAQLACAARLRALPLRC
jgi:Transposase DDE domain group 1